MPSLRWAAVRAQTANTQIIQEIESKRRSEQARKARTEDKDIASLMAKRPGPADYDYLTLIVLAASVVILAFVAGKKRGAGLRL